MNSFGFIIPILGSIHLARASKAHSVAGFNAQEALVKDLYPAFFLSFMEMLDNVSLMIVQSIIFCGVESVKLIQILTDKFIGSDGMINSLLSL